MGQQDSKWRVRTPAKDTEQLLESYYSRLMEWGCVLTRGDANKAQDIVHDFCLYLSLTRPDLSAVANLDGYLYTCLRHLYLSDLARSSREALQVFSVAEFDSFEFALATKRPGDPLQRQNDLRSICNYAVWRKETSKSASYFILHFFHGYARHEIAELACLPISAIYNKLKTARAEVKGYLDDRNKFHLVSRSLPPGPFSSWKLVSTAEIFKELRELILQSRNSECLPEEEILAPYRSQIRTPISCSVLAHLASCERCLTVIDRHFRRPTLKDRESLDGPSSSAENKDSNEVLAKSVTRIAALRSVRRQWNGVHEHRPTTLSIAVNGRIIAFHDVQGVQSVLSARIERPENAQFVEVFSEQDVRLALLPLGDAPPQGPQSLTQRVTLSDARWIELNLTFDGLGLNSEVAYFDPALAGEAPAEDAQEDAVEFERVPAHSLPSTLTNRWHKSRWSSSAIARLLRAVVPNAAPAWAMVLVIVTSMAGFMAYRHLSAPVDALDLLTRSVAIEAASLKGQTEHQVLTYEDVSADGQILLRGTVDLWRDGDGSRYLRRLYDSQHRMLAARWRNSSGEHHSYTGEGEKGQLSLDSPDQENPIWDQDISAKAFGELGGRDLHVSVTKNGYELTIIGTTGSRPHLVSASLSLDRNLRPLREVLRVQSGGDVHEVRLVLARYERQPSRSVPDGTFDPGDSSISSLQNSDTHSEALQHGPSGPIPSNAQLTELQIAVLYQLARLGADTNDPIEVVKTMDGHIRVSGTVADDARKKEIVSSLERLTDRQRLDLKLISPGDVRIIPGYKRVNPSDIQVYEAGNTKPAADAVLRTYFSAKGYSDERLNLEVERFSRDVLQHAQSALQHAYALNRLESVISSAELESVEVSSQQQWTEMTNQHAASLESQLRALENELAKISPEGRQNSNSESDLKSIESPAQFQQAANQLLRQAQDLDREVGLMFASNTTPEKAVSVDSLLTATIKIIPLQQAANISRFAVHLSSSQASASLNRRRGLGKPMTGTSR